MVRWLIIPAPIIIAIVRDSSTLISDLAKIRVVYYLIHLAKAKENFLSKQMDFKEVKHLVFMELADKSNVEMGVFQSYMQTDLQH